MGSCKQENNDTANVKNVEEHKKNVSIKQEKPDIWISNDETAPQSWKTALNPDITKSVCKRFMNSQGKIFQNRIDAIKYLLEDEKHNKDDLEVMKIGLIADGWMTENFLPHE